MHGGARGGEGILLGGCAVGFEIFFAAAGEGGVVGAGGGAVGSGGLISWWVVGERGEGILQGEGGEEAEVLDFVAEVDVLVGLG